jgi:hypothetical protein
MSRWIFALLASGALSAQPSVELEGRYWFSNVNSRIRVESQGVGTDIDAKTDLGFTNTSFPEVHAALRWGYSRLSFQYTPIEFTGDRTVSRTLVFNGRTYTFGTRVVSDLQVKHLQLGWTYHFQFLDGRLKLGPTVEAQGFLISGALNAPAVNVASKEDLSVGLPTVGPSLEITPHRRLDLYGRATGMSAGSYGHFIGSEAGVRVRPFRFVQLSAGYRTFNLQVANSPDFAHLHLGGPFIGAGLIFP